MANTPQEPMERLEALGELLATRDRDIMDARAQGALWREICAATGLSKAMVLRIAQRASGAPRA